MIEKKIHYCWFGGAPLPPLAERCIQSWRTQMPDYPITRWDEDNTDLSSAYAQACIKAKKWAFLSDYIRLKVLYEHGGIYLDVDVEAVRSMDALLAHKLFMGWESKDHVNAGVIGAQRGNPHLKILSDRIAAQTLDTRRFVAIPKLITDYLRELAQTAPEEVALMEPAYFYPYNPWDTTRGVGQLMASDITDRTYSIHHWQHSWKDQGLKRLFKRARLRLGWARDF